QAVAESFLDYRQSRTQTRIDDQTQKVQGQIQDRLDDLQQLLASLEETADPSAERELLQAQIDSVSTQIGQLRSTLTELSTGSTDPGQVVTPAAVPPAGLLTSKMIFIVAGIVLAVGAVLALMLLRS